MDTIKYIDRQSGQLKTESPAGEVFLKFLYHTALGEVSLQLLAKRKILTAWYGRKMNRHASRNKINAFVKQFNIDMHEVQIPEGGFVSFNDFFYRKLKPDARPIATGLVSPADGKILAFENIGDVAAFFVKGIKFTLAGFLNNPELAQKYKNASMFVVRLAPDDYHRFHFPLDGKVSDVTKIKGSYFSVSPYAVIPNFGRVFCQNKREFVELANPQIGNLLISPVGATMVGSIIETFLPDTLVQAGHEMGYFAFGGSSIVLLVSNDRIKINADILENTANKLETSIKMGEQIAELI